MTTDVYGDEPMYRLTLSNGHVYLNNSPVIPVYKDEDVITIAVPREAKNVSTDSSRSFRWTCTRDLSGWLVVIIVDSRFPVTSVSIDEDIIDNGHCFIADGDDDIGFFGENLIDMCD